MRSNKLKSQISKVECLGGFAPVILVLLIAIIGILGVVFYKSFYTPSVPKSSLDQEMQEDQQVKDLRNISDSDEISVIETELAATDVNNLDQGMQEAVLGVSDY